MALMQAPSGGAVGEPFSLRPLWPSPEGEGKDPREEERKNGLEFAAKLARGADKVLSLIAVLMILLLLCYGGYSLWDTAMLYKGAFNSSDLLQYKPSADDPESLTFEELLKLNPDVCAWITVDDTHIDYPVVQGEDNMEYVNKDVQGEFAFSGAIFLDSQNKRDFSDSFNLLYGHHMEGGAMFGDIAEFRDKSYFDSHETGTLYLPGKAIPITFFACVSIDAFDSVVYHPDAQPAGDVTTLLNHIQGTAVQYRDIGVTAKDQIIGLSTCSEAVTNGRVVLFGRLDK